jgi:hypothetical protein
MRRISLAILGTFAAACVLASAHVASAAPDLRLKPALNNVSAPKALVQIGKTTKTDQMVRAKTNERLSLGPSNGKPGKQSLFNTTMLIKSGALSKVSPASKDRSSARQVNTRYYDATRRWASNGKPGKQSLLNTTMLMKGGAMQKPDAIRNQRDTMRSTKGTASGPKRWVSNGKKGSMRLLKVTMLIKGGCMAKPDAIKTRRETIQQKAARRSGRTRSRRVRNLSRFVNRKPPRALNQGMVFRRERVGRFCTSRNCER